MIQRKIFTVYNNAKFVKLFFEKENGIFSFLNPYSAINSPDKENIIYGIDSFYLAKYILKISSTSFDNSSFAPMFFDFCIMKDLKIIFIGANKIENNNFINNLKTKYPNLNCSGINGFENENIYINKLKLQKFDIVVVGVGSPLQEILSLKLFTLYPNLKFITCGGYIRQASIKLNYFPQFFIFLNIRFLYRFLNESHVFKRTLISYTKFLFYYIYGKIKFNRF